MGSMGWVYWVDGVHEAHEQGCNLVSQFKLAFASPLHNLLIQCKCTWINPCWGNSRVQSTADIQQKDGQYVPSLLQLELCTSDQSDSFLQISAH